MLHSPRKKVIIYQPFKNASTSLGRFFLQSPYFQEILGEHPNWNVDKIEVPQEFERPHGSHTHVWFSWRLQDFKEYDVYVPIRNPYDRTVSMYKFYLQHCTKKNINPLGFSDWLLREFKQPIHLPVTQVYNYTQLIKVEQIEEDVSKLVEKHDIFFRRTALKQFPHNNKSQEIEEIKMTQFEKDVIYFWHYQDFINGGYER